MVFVALNGYHGVAKYSWSLNNEELEEQVHSIMYTNTPVCSNAQIVAPSVEARKEFNIRNTTVRSMYVVLEVEGDRKVIVEGATHTNWVSFEYGIQL